MVEGAQKAANELKSAIVDLYSNILLKESISEEKLFEKIKFSLSAYFEREIKKVFENYPKAIDAALENLEEFFAATPELGEKLFNETLIKYFSWEEKIKRLEKKYEKKEKEKQKMKNEDVELFKKMLKKIIDNFVSEIKANLTGTGIEKKIIEYSSNLIKDEISQYKYFNWEELKKIANDLNNELLDGSPTKELFTIFLKKNGLYQY